MELNYNRQYYVTENHPDPQFIRQLEKLTRSYEVNMEHILAKLDQWLEMRRITIDDFQITLRRFYFLKKITTGITLTSLTCESAVVLRILMQKFFHCHMNSKYETLMHILMGISITFSLFTLTYSNNSIEDFLRELREGKYLLREIETVFRRGNWIDKEVCELFPHGIDLELILRQVLDVDGDLPIHWKQVVYSAIISNNIRKDEKLTSDVEFSASVEAFVENAVAEIWIKRMKLRKLLDYMEEKTENFPDKRAINGTKPFLTLAATNVYSYCFLLFSSNTLLKGMQLLRSFLSMISTAFSFGDIDCFEDVGATLKKLQIDYNHVKKDTHLFADYD